MINYENILNLLNYNKTKYSIDIENGNGVIRIANLNCNVDDDFTETSYDLSDDEEASAFLENLIIINNTYITNLYLGKEL